MDRGTFLIPALAALVFGGIAYSETLTRPRADDGRVHVAYWEKWTGFEFDAMKRVVDTFNREQDRIHVDLLSVSGINDKTLMAIAANDPPDLAGLEDEHITQFVDDHALMPLDDLAREAGLTRDKYVPAYYDQGVVRGRLYALPTTPATVALHYNRELMRAAGLDPNRPPKTTRELADMADRITRKDKAGHLVVSGFLPTEPGWWNWFWCPMFGGRFWDGKGRITIDEPESVRGFEYAQRFAQKYGADAISTAKGGLGNFDSPQNGFMTKRIAMEIQGVWMYNFVHSYAPKLDWAAAPIPYPDDRPDLARTSPVNTDNLCLPRGSKHPREAWEFVRFVESQRGMEMLCLGQKKPSALRDVSPAFYAKHPNPFIRMFADLAYSPNAKGVPRMGIWPEYSDEINAAFDTIMLDQKPAKQALSELKARMQPKLDRYLRRLRQRGEG